MPKRKKIREYPTNLAFAIALAKEGQGRTEEFLRRMNEIPQEDGNYDKALNALRLEFGGKVVSPKKERRCQCGQHPFSQPIYRGCPA